jgi:cytochrome c oxidase subunit 3
MRSQFPDWRPLQDPSLLWFNTGLLVLGSIALQLARGAARRENLDSLRLSLTTGGALTIAFLIGQLVAWQQLTDAGYFITTNPADAFFYILTGLHGLHMLGGLWFWARACLSVWRKLETSPVMEITNVRLRVELCSVYWHYLLLIWLLLFGLLLST